MLRRHIFHGLVSLLAFLVTDAHAEKPYTPAGFCVQACYESISGLTFGDFDPTQLYVAMHCNSYLAVSSVYACYDLRCSSRFSVDESFDQLNAYCEEYGTGPLNGTYSDVIQDVIAQYGSVAGVPEIDPTSVPITDIINNTVIANTEYYDLSYKTLVVWQHEMHMHHAFGWSMYILAAGVVFFGAFNRLMAFAVRRLLAKGPLPLDAERSAALVGKGAAPNTGLFSKMHNLWAKHVILPATFGYRHIQPLGWCTIPTRLQSILVFVYFALNFIFCAIDWRLFPGNTYWPDTPSQFWRYFSDRTGIICFANLPLVWLFAGRNDVLLWLTGWSFSTFNIFHRYAARIATVQAILHSIGYTIQYYNDTGDWSEYRAELPFQWFYCGIGGTVLMSLLIGFSILPLRAKVYELFLAVHVSFSVVILIFLFLHVRIFDGEYDPYLWACVGFWVVDRALRLARLIVLNFRVALPGKGDALRRSLATVTYDAAGDIIRLAVRPSTNLCVGPGVHYYIYTPTASMFRLWENHPFTLGSWSRVPAALPGSDTPQHGSVLRAHGGAPASPSTDSKSEYTSRDCEQELHPTQQELVFLIRPYKGMTQTLKKQLLAAPGHAKDMRVLIEGPYGVPADLAPFERVLMISGGSGVTGTLAYLYAHLYAAQAGTASAQRMRFVWAAREPGFVADLVEKDLAPFVRRADTRLDFFLTRGADKADGPAIVENAIARAAPADDVDSEKDGKMGKVAPAVRCGRPDVAALLNEEIAQLVGAGSRLAVVVCGPGRLADDVRREVVRCIGTKVDASQIELHEESFGW